MFQKVKRNELAGFWTREADSVVEGVVAKFVPTENAGFYIINTVRGDTPLQGSQDGKTPGRQSVVGEVIGVSGSTALDVLRDFVQKGTVRLTSRGQQPGKNGKQGFWDIEVEHDPDGKPSTMQTPSDKLPF